VTQQGPEEVLEGILKEANETERQQAETEAEAKAEARLAERTADLQRLQAEYANYRKRVDRDRGAVREQAVVSTLTGLLPVLDAIGQAREHGELSGGFKSVADSLQSALGKLGLVTYGEKGDPFDPKIHEALTHSYSSEVAEVTCVEILQPGYKVGDRILRPARVAVAEPATGPDGSSNEAGWPTGEGDN
jgi:molecular chaperone GrpE